MKLFGLAGWSGSGKTTLMVRLIEELIGRGLTVSTIKHAHHAFDIDQPGKDSYRHRAAGAREVMVGSRRRWALMHELEGEPEPELGALIAPMAPVDILLIEGFKRDSHPKMEVYRAANNKPFLYPDDPHIVAVASDTPVAGLVLPGFDLNDPVAIAGFIIGHCGLADDAREADHGPA